MTRVKASEAVPRLAPNSVCTTGSATTTDHMPTLPSEPISTATASRVHARRESGTNRSESRVSSEEIATAARNFGGYSPKVKPQWRDIGHAIAGEHRPRLRTQCSAFLMALNPANAPCEIRECQLG